MKISLTIDLDVGDLMNGWRDEEIRQTIEKRLLDEHEPVPEFLN